MNDIAFHGTLDEQTYAGAVRGTKSTRRILIALVIILAVLIITAATSHDAQTLLPAIFLCAIWIMLLWRAAGTKARRQLAGNKSLQGPMRGVAREGTIEIVTDYTTSAFPWNVLHHYERVGDVMLLFHAPGAAFILPRKFFGSDAEWDAFCALVAANVPAKVKQGGAGTVKALALWIVIIVAVFLLWSLSSTH